MGPLRLGILLLCNCMKVSCLKGGPVLGLEWALPAKLPAAAEESGSCKKSALGLVGFWSPVAGYKRLGAMQKQPPGLTHSQTLIADVLKGGGSRWLRTSRILNNAGTMCVLV